MNQSWFLRNCLHFSSFFWMVESRAASSAGTTIFSKLTSFRSSTLQMCLQIRRLLSSRSFRASGRSGSIESNRNLRSGQSVSSSILSFIEGEDFSRDSLTRLRTLLSRSSSSLTMLSHYSWRVPTLTTVQYRDFLRMSRQQLAMSLQSKKVRVSLSLVSACSAHPYKVSVMYSMFSRLNRQISSVLSGILMGCCGLTTMLSLQLISYWGLILLLTSTTSIFLRSCCVLSLMGLTLRGMCRELLSMRLTSLAMDFSSNGQTPKSIQQRTTPMDQTSALQLQICPLSISGAMQMGEPTMVCVMSVSFMSSLQNPKSASLMTPSWNRMLVGFRSRCSIFSFTSTRKASTICANILRASGSLRILRFSKSCANVPPLQYSYTRQQLFMVRSISMNFIMWLLLIFVRMLISLEVNSDSLGVILNFYTCITLTATTDFDFWSSAMNTFPYCPEPRRSFRTQFSITLFVIFKFRISKQLAEIVNRANSISPILENGIATQQLQSDSNMSKPRRIYTDSSGQFQDVQQSGDIGPPAPIQNQVFVLNFKKLATGAAEPAPQPPVLAQKPPQISQGVRPPASPYSGPPHPIGQPSSFEHCQGDSLHFANVPPPGKSNTQTKDEREVEPLFPSQGLSAMEPPAKAKSPFSEEFVNPTKCSTGEMEIEPNNISTFDPPPISSSSMPDKSQFKDSYLLRDEEWACPKPQTNQLRAPQSSQGPAPPVVSPPAPPPPVFEKPLPRLNQGPAMSPPPPATRLEKKPSQEEGYISKHAPPPLTFEKKASTHTPGGEASRSGHQKKNSGYANMGSDPDRRVAGGIYDVSDFSRNPSDAKYGISPPPVRFPENKRGNPILLSKSWRGFLEDKALEWSNCDNFPTEIVVMLNVFKEQYGASPIRATSESYKAQMVSEVVSSPKPLTEHINQYKGNQKLRKSLESAMRGYPVYRMIRGDGNCFYRAFICGYLELALTSRNACYFFHLLFELYRVRQSFETDCKDEEILPPAEMVHFLFHKLLQIYTYRVTLTKNRDPDLQRKVVSMFYRMLNEKPFQFDMYLVIGLRSYVKTLIEQNRELSQIFGEEIKMNAIRDVETYGLESEDNEVVIVQLCNSLLIKVTLFYLQKSSNIVTPKELEPVDFRRAEEVVLFFRPGHYDLIYKESISKLLYPEESESVRQQPEGWTNQSKYLPSPSSYDHAYGRN